MMKEGMLYSWDRSLYHATSQRPPFVLLKTIPCYLQRLGSSNVHICTLQSWGRVTKIPPHESPSEPRDLEKEGQWGVLTQNSTSNQKLCTRAKIWGHRRRVKKNIEFGGTWGKCGTGFLGSERNTSMSGGKMEENREHWEEHVRRKDGKSLKRLSSQHWDLLVGCLGCIWVEEGDVWKHEEPRLEGTQIIPYDFS